MTKNLHISPSFSMPAVDYANQGNSLIGIRGSGKTYAATKIAEELLEAGIPIIAFDPTGVWQNLRNGVDGNKGYPVVVAGGINGDLPLTESNAVDIVAAALKAGVSLVIDLKGMSTSNKSSWMRIVSNSVEYLLGHNDQYGLRHVFIEEAAEFVPQRPNPGGQLAYSRIESLARMGRNFGLGYTLINQRAEEIAKAIFEISEQVLVFRQSGKNSLKSITDWLNFRGLKDKKIVDTLPRLENGECWIINEQLEITCHISKKKTFHPDPKASKVILPAHIHTADSTAFIDKMKKAMEKPPSGKSDLKEKPHSNSKELIEKDKIIAQLQEEVATLQQHVLYFKDILLSVKNENYAMSNLLNSAAFTKTVVAVNKLPVTVSKVAESDTKYAKSGVETIKVEYSGSNTVTGGAMRMLKAAAQYHPNEITKMRMATLARLSHSSGSFGTYLSTLKREGLITANGNIFTITDKGLKEAGNVEPLPTDPKVLIEFWCDIIGNQGGASRMLRALGERYPKTVSRDHLGELVGMSSSSGSFGTYLSTLKRNGLIKTEGRDIKAADELFN